MGAGLAPQLAMQRVGASPAPPATTVVLMSTALGACPKLPSAGSAAPPSSLHTHGLIQGKETLPHAGAQHPVSARACCGGGLGGGRRCACLGAPGGGLGGGGPRGGCSQCGGPGCIMGAAKCGCMPAC